MEVANAKVGDKTGRNLPKEHRCMGTFFSSARAAEALGHLGPHRPIFKAKRTRCPWSSKRAPTPPIDAAIVVVVVLVTMTATPLVTVATLARLIRPHKTMRRQEERSATVRIDHRDQQVFPRVLVHHSAHEVARERELLADGRVVDHGRQAPVSRDALEHPAVRG